MAKTTSTCRRLGAALISAATLVCPPAQADDLGRGLNVKVGEALFERLWASSPASTTSSDGLGPLYSARSCAACHPAQGLGQSPKLIARLTPPDPVYGRQIQTHAVAGLPAEAQLDPGWEPHEITLRGETFVLRRPQPSLGALAHGPLAATTRMGLRQAPVLHGMDALDQIPDAAIIANADPDDTDHDGIAGRASWLPDGRLGRFGWQANEPDLRTQTASAFSTDLGLGTPEFPDPWGDCTATQTTCRTAPHGGIPEIGDQVMALLDEFLRAVPAPQPTAPSALFTQTGCAGCHLPSLGGVPAYTDLLLHDMGPDLADAGGASQWRTAPLWGLGLTDPRPARTTYLHDGRARSVQEAILWHDGEAAHARDNFLTLSASDRAELVAFLESL